MNKTIFVFLGIFVGSALAFFPESENRVVAEPNIESNNDVRLVELECRVTDLEHRLELIDTVKESGSETDFECAQGVCKPKNPKIFRNERPVKRLFRRFR